MGFRRDAIRGSSSRQGRNSTLGNQDSAGRPICTVREYTFHSPSPRMSNDSPIGVYTQQSPGLIVGDAAVRRRSSGAGDVLCPQPFAVHQLRSFLNQYLTPSGSGNAGDGSHGFEVAGSRVQPLAPRDGVTVGGVDDGESCCIGERQCWKLIEMAGQARDPPNAGDEAAPPDWSALLSTEDQEWIHDSAVAASEESPAHGHMVIPTIRFTVVDVDTHFLHTPTSPSKQSSLPSTAAVRLQKPKFTISTPDNQKPPNSGPVTKRQPLLEATQKRNALTTQCSPAGGKSKENHLPVKCAVEKPAPPSLPATPRPALRALGPAKRRLSLMDTAYHPESPLCKPPVRTPGGKLMALRNLKVWRGE